MNATPRDSCYGCSLGSEDVATHSHPGGCRHTWEVNGTHMDASGPVRWPTRESMTIGGNAVDSMTVWIDRLEDSTYVPILVSTGTTTIQGEEKGTFTLYMKDVFPNDYQTFYMIMAIQAHVTEQPKPFPAWVRFSRGTGSKLVYNAKIVNLKAAEIEAFLPKMPVGVALRRL